MVRVVKLRVLYIYIAHTRELALTTRTLRHSAGGAPPTLSVGGSSFFQEWQLCLLCRSPSSWLYVSYSPPSPSNQTSAIRAQVQVSVTACAIKRKVSSHTIVHTFMVASNAQLLSFITAMLHTFLRSTIPLVPSREVEEKETEGEREPPRRWTIASGLAVSFITMSRICIQVKPIVY